MKKRIIVLTVLILSFCEVSLAAKRSRFRKPASNSGVVINYKVDNAADILSLHLYPYGSYLDFRGVYMSCVNEESGDLVKWSCVNEEGKGSASIEFTKGYKVLSLLSYEPGCDPEPAKCNKVTEQMVFKMNKVGPN